MGPNIDHGQKGMVREVIQDVASLDEVIRSLMRERQREREREREKEKRDPYIRNLHFYKDNSQYWLYNSCFLLYVYRTILWDRERRHSTGSKAGKAAGIL